MKPLLDTEMSEGKASSVGMINNSERGTLRHQDELPGPEDCDTIKKIVESSRELRFRHVQLPALGPGPKELLAVLPRGTRE